MAQNIGETRSPAEGSGPAKTQARHPVLSTMAHAAIQDLRCGSLRGCKCEITSRHFRATEARLLEKCLTESSAPGQIADVAKLECISRDSVQRQVRHATAGAADNHGATVAQGLVDHQAPGFTVARQHQGRALLEQHCNIVQALAAQERDGVGHIQLGDAICQFLREWTGTHKIQFCFRILGRG